MRDDRIWRWYAFGAFVFALLPGFLLGGLIFLTYATNSNAGNWQFGASSAHAHAQLFGWTTLLILGVALHFLPRLRGVRLQHPGWARLALLLIVVGLGTRTIAQPLLAEAAGELWRQLVMLAAALIEAVGVILAIATLGTTLAQPIPDGKGAMFREIRGFLLVGLIGLQVATLLNVVRFIDSGPLAMSLFAAQAEAATNIAGFYGFVLPIAIGMSVRTFPLYAHVHPVRRWPLSRSLEMLTMGAVLAVVGMLIQQHEVFSIGQVLLALGIIFGIVAVRIFEPRRQLPRRSSSPWRDPLQLLMMSAYVWLFIAAVVLAVDGLDQDQLLFEVEYHLIGAGFITLLIFGVGSHLLPGFAKTTLRAPGISWLILIIGNIAVVARLTPTLSQISATAGESAGAIAGLAAAVALLLFIWNIRFSVR